MAASERPGRASWLLTSAIAVGLVARWALRWHPWATTTVAALFAVGVLVNPLSVLLVAATGCVVLALWAWRWPGSFIREVLGRVRSGWRFECIYRWRWTEAMALFGLTAQVPARLQVGNRPARVAQRRPEMVRFTSTPAVDRLLVKHRLGHEQAHWDIRTEALAQSFGALSCKVVPHDPGYLWLVFRTQETLERVVAPAPVLPAERVDLGALRVGITEDGDPWRLRLRGTHLLIGGATDAGKSSLLWDIIGEIAPGIPAGLFQLWPIDPKGGMELRAGEPMYERYAYPDIGPSEDFAGSELVMVQQLEAAARLVTQRAGRLRRAGRRKNVITAEEPAVIVIVDELAYLTIYMSDPALRRRAHLAMGIVLSQGRAVDVILIGAIQDVRKEAIPLRDLFPTRVALRTTEAAHADLILGDGAYKAGALTDHIPESLPGVGYVRLDGHPTPIRVRAAYHSDAAITALAAAYPAPTNAAMAEAGEDLGEAA